MFKISIPTIQITMVYLAMLPYFTINLLFEPSFRVTELKFGHDMKVSMM